VIEKSVQINNRTGLHARPASKFVQEASRFRCEITLSKDGRTVNAKSMISVLSLGANCGATLLIRTSGVDEIPAMDGLVALLETLPGEEQ